MTNLTDENERNELTLDQLNGVSGGGKKIDASSPLLFQACCTGKHFPTAKLTVR